MAKLPSIVFLATAGCALFLAIAFEGAPQTKTVYGTVRSVEDKAVAQTQIRTDTGASDVTTDSGGFGFPLVPPLQVGFPVIFYVTGWLVVEPCTYVRGRTYLPDPAAEEITVKALRKGDKRLLSSRGSIGCIVLQKAAQFVGLAPPTDRKGIVSGLFNPSEPAGSQIGKPNLFHLYPYAAIAGSTFLLLPSSRYSLLSIRSVSFDEGQDSPDDFLQEQAKELGFTTEQLSKAINEWTNSATDPYEQGLAALYEQRYSDASRLILESINASPKGPIERYVPLARAEYELGNYAAAEAALRKVLAVHSQDPLILNNLGVVLKAEAKSAEAEPASDQEAGKAKSAEAEPTPDQKADKEFYTPKDRVAAIQASSIFAPKAVGDADILQGPVQDPKQFQFHPNDKVICDFDKPGSQMGGKTPKFSCKITRVESASGQVQVLTEQIVEEPVKVKFGAGDNEIYAEVVSTRLFWALGYYADSWFPVKVECHNCPADPESGSGAKDTRSYDAATIVRKYPGHKMYEEGKSDQGWSWKELDQNNGRPDAEKDGLKLLGAFVQHSDNKPQQQRLVCNGVKVDQSTHPFTTTCEQSKMIVQDLGATFGGGGMFTGNDSAKMNLHEWSGKALWKKTGKPGMSEADCPVCQAQLSKSLTAKDGLGDPTISEEGRRFLAGLMCQLSDGQIEDLFKAAQVASMPKYHNSDGSFKQGLDEATIDKQWVEAFKAKREELASGRCRWKNRPADLAPIDNPMGLSTVPNHCTAPPH